MPNIPYPITADSIEELKSQLYEMLRQLFEDKIGGLDLGDVFLNSGDIMSLRLSSTGGLEKVSNNLQNFYGDDPNGDVAAVVGSFVDLFGINSNTYQKNKKK
jgi:hypothetical protein